MTRNIVAENLSRFYGETAALDGFSACFAGGEITCLLGPSGCGKTTLLRLLLGLEHPDSGCIRGLEGVPVSAVFQEDRLVPGLSAMGNLLLCCPGTGREELEAQLARVGLSREDIHRPARELSGGMRRRVAIVRAMAASSQAVVMDEPFKGLDPDTWQQTADYVLESRKGRTLIAVTHDERDVEALGARVVRMPTLASR